MKHLLKLIYITILSFAVLYPFTVMGVEKGMKRTAARSVLEEKGAIINHEFSREKQDAFVIKKFAYIDANALLLLYDNQDRVFKVIILTDEMGYATAWNTFDRLKGSLESKYGEGEHIEFYNDPYQKGDGYTQQAMELNKASKILHIKNEDCSILAQVKPSTTYNDQFYYIIIYEYVTLAKPYLDSLKTKQEEDL